MAVSTRLSLTVRHNAHVKSVALGVHVVCMDGTLEREPLRVTHLVPGVEHCPVVSGLLGLTLTRTTDDPVSVELTHCDPDIPRRLEVTLLRDLPGEAAVELDRFDLRPGYSTDVHLLAADAAMIRELPIGFREWP